MYEGGSKGGERSEKGREGRGRGVREREREEGG
jgi:hypothetical protein